MVKQKVTIENPTGLHLRPARASVQGGIAVPEFDQI